MLSIAAIVTLLRQKLKVVSENNKPVVFQLATKFLWSKVEAYMVLVSQKF